MQEGAKPSFRKKGGSIMTMNEYYSMSIRAGMELRKQVESLGKFLREEFIPEYYRNSKVYQYRGNVYWIDGILGIIDIK